MSIIMLLVVIAAVVIGGIVLHVGGVMIWTTILEAIDRRFPRKERRRAVASAIELRAE
jgi:divalent metal cation (Fe/Co/Zn/Cd) transporter